MSNKFGIEVARKFSRANESDWVEYFEALRQRGQLSEAMRQMNAMLDVKEDRQLAVAAIRRIGLWHDDCDDYV